MLLVCLMCCAWQAVHASPAGVRLDPGPASVAVFDFIRAGTGKHWFWNGTTTYQLLAWDDATIDASLVPLAGLGVNRLRVALGLRDGGAQQLITAHGGQTAAVDTFGDQPWLALDTVYRCNGGCARSIPRRLRKPPVVRGGGARPTVFPRLELPRPPGLCLRRQTSATFPRIAQYLKVLHAGRAHRGTVPEQQMSRWRPAP